MIEHNILGRVLLIFFMQSDTTVAIMASKIEKVSRGSTAEREESQGPSVESEVVVLIEVDVSLKSSLVPGSMSHANEYTDEEAFQDAV